MRAGDLRHVIVIDKPVAFQNPTGEEEIRWTPWLRRWASIEPLRGAERAAADTIISTTDTRIRLRWTPGIERINPKWRARHRVAGVDTIYNIDSIIDLDRRHEEVQLLCSSGSNNG